MNWKNIIAKLLSLDSDSEPKTKPNRMTVFELIRLLRSAGGALLIQVSLYGQLARVEWEEEKNRLIHMLVAAFFGFICVLCMLFFLGILVLALSWDTHYRIHAIVALMAFYGLGIMIAWYRFQMLSALSSQAFIATREELAADIALIKSKLNNNEDNA